MTLCPLQEVESVIEEQSVVERKRGRIDIGFHAGSAVGRQEDESEMVAPVTSIDEDAWLPRSLAAKQKEDLEIAEFCDILNQFPDRRPSWSEIEGVQRIQ